MLTEKNNRIEVVDAIRGLALFFIVVLSCVKQYDLPPVNIEWQPEWLNKFDLFSLKIIEFAMQGKAYSAFALLFGFSLFMQYQNAQLQGINYKGRFAWRMIIFIILAQLNALVYSGDMLVLYALVAIILIPTVTLKSKPLLIIAIVLLCQPYQWTRVIHAIMDSNYIPVVVNHVSHSGNFLEFITANISTNQLANIVYKIETGVMSQTAGLFIFGILLARHKIFEITLPNKKFWKTSLKIALILVVPLKIVKENVANWLSNTTIAEPLEIITTSIANIAVMTIMVSFFTLMWFREGGYDFQKLFALYGKMSLSNYIVQSYIGVAIYYAVGLGLAPYLGITMSFFVGSTIFALQLIVSKYWLENHDKGPLEYIWAKITWI